MRIGAGEERHRGRLALCWLVADRELRDRVFPRLRAEWQGTIDALLAIMNQEALHAGFGGARESIRAFGFFSHLANIAEDQHQIRDLHAQALGGNGSAGPPEGTMAHAKADAFYKQNLGQLRGMTGL